MLHVTTVLPAANRIRLAVHALSPCSITPSALQWIADVISLVHASLPGVRRDQAGAVAAALQRAP
jgi:hypothetical protein